MDCRSRWSSGCSSKCIKPSCSVSRDTGITPDGGADRPWPSWLGGSCSLRGGNPCEGQTPYGLLGLADLDTRHKHESESEWCQAHHVRNPIATSTNDYTRQTTHVAFHNG